MNSRMKINIKSMAVFYYHLSIFLRLREEQMNFYLNFLFIKFFPYISKTNFQYIKKVSNRSLIYFFSRAKDLLNNHGVERTNTLDIGQSTMPIMKGSQKR